MIEEAKEVEKMAWRLQKQSEALEANSKLLPRGPVVRKEWHDFSGAAIYLLSQNKRPEATELMAQHVQRECRIKTLRSDTKPEMWIYREGVYVPEGETFVLEICRELIGEAYQSRYAEDVVRKVQADTYIDADTFFGKAQKFPNLLPVKNGILNIDTGQLLPFDPEIYFFNKLPAEYAPAATCPAIQSFLREVLESQEDLKVLQEFFGFCLLREYRYEKSLLLRGSGRNGKGKTLNLIEMLMGPANCSNISLHDIEKDKFALSELHHKMVNISGDITSEAIQHSGYFKSLTGRDQLQVARKNLRRIHLVNYAKMIFAANELPPTRDITNGFFDRWILIEFPFRFLPENEIQALSPEERRNVKPQNPRILDEITSPRELSGLLNWALEGYRRLAAQDGFSYSATTQQRREEWTRASDSFLAFCMDCVEQDWSNDVSKGELRQAYAAYCTQHKLRRVGDRRIKAALEDLFGASESRETQGPYRATVWTGIKLKQNSSGKDVKDVKANQFQLKGEVAEAKRKYPDKRDDPDYSTDRRALTAAFESLHKEGWQLLTIGVLTERSALEEDRVRDLLATLTTEGTILESRPQHWQLTIQ